MSDKRIFRKLLSSLISVGIALPLPALAQNNSSQRPSMAFLGGGLVRPMSSATPPAPEARGTITRFVLDDNQEVVVSQVEITPDNLEVVVDAAVAKNPGGTVFAVPDGAPDPLRTLVEKKYPALKDQLQSLGPVTETAALQSKTVPQTLRQKIVGFFKKEKEKRHEEWKGVAYSVAIGSFTGTFNYVMSGSLTEASMAFGAMFAFSLLMTAGEKGWLKYLDGGNRFAKFVATVGGRYKYSEQTEKALGTLGEIGASWMANAMLATSMQFVDGSANFGTWAGAKETMWHSLVMGYLMNGQVIDSTLIRWRRMGLVTDATIKKYMVTPAILLTGGVLDAMTLNHVSGVTYIAGTLIGAGITYAFGGESFENKYRQIKRASLQRARAKVLCSTLLNGPVVKPRMPPISFSYAYAR